MSQDMAMVLLQQAVNGLAVGCIYGLVALGFVLIYKATEVVNFAQGDILMFGAFAAWTVIATLDLPYWLAFPLIVLLTALLGAGLDMLVMRPIVGQPQFAGIMLTIGLAFTIRGLVTLFWGPENRSFDTPFSNKTTSFAGLIVSDVTISIVAGTIVMTILLFAFFRFTRLGVAMQAASQNQLAAYLMAIPVKTVNSLVWGISAGVSAAAGILLAPALTVEVNLWFVVLKGFGAAILGGFGSIPGALIGGILIGLAEQFVGFYLPSAKGITAYAVLLAVLILYPKGLFGGGERKRV
ncbi:MAG: branched-chain amino acid ABC transporter permease [Alphaproteobacteria bacterium]